MISYDAFFISADQVSGLQAMGLLKKIRTYTKLIA